MALPREVPAARRSPARAKKLVKQAVQIVPREVSTTALQTLVTSTHALISPAARAAWCEYYVEYAPSGAQSGSSEDCVQSLNAAYKWVDSVIVSKPHLFQSAALASYYEYVLDTAQSLLPAVGESSVGEDALHRFIESVAEKAVEKCPHEASFWHALDQAQQQRGDHKAATHTRWRRDKALGSA